MAETRLRILSLGAGVQSTTVALMAAHGEITPMPDAAIFADTGNEPTPVYRHLQWLMSGNILPFPIHIVNNGNIRDDVTSIEVGRYASVPFFLEMPDGTQGLGRRQCSKEYKLTPIGWKLRDLLGVGRRDRIPAGSVEVWIGISTDEAARIKPSSVKWQVNCWPLIDARMSRWDCYNWLERRDYPVVRPVNATPDRPEWPPKSACKICPYRDNAGWRAMRDGRYPEDFDDAKLVDRIIRSGGTQKEKGLNGKQYIHRNMVPLGDVDLSTAEDRGQLNLFINECEGICGV